MAMDVYEHYNDQFSPDEFSYGEDLWDPLELVPEETHDLKQFEISELFQETLSEDLRQLSESIHTATKVTGMEVGDDRVDLSYNPRTLFLELFFQESVFMMKTSKEDTSITKTTWNFCETTGMLPAAKEQSFHYSRKTGNFDNLSFIDCPPLRIILDTRKGERSHSNSSVGKSSMLGSRVYACRTELRDALDISSFLQDGNLSTAKMPDPKYLPKVMGGCGNVSPFRNSVNTYLYVKSYKGGTYERVYGTATNELIDCIYLNEIGQPAEPVFSTRLRDKQEYLHGTYEEKVFVPDVRPIKSEYWEVPEPIYKAAGTSIGISSVENRLIRAKQLVTRSVAREVVQQTDRLLQAIKGVYSINSLNLITKRKSWEIRQEYENALQANSAFQRLLSRCSNDYDVSKLLSERFFRTITSGRLHFTLQDAEWLDRGGKGRFLTIHDLRTSEDMYVLDEISVEETFRVGGIPLRVRLNNNVKETYTRARIGLYEISKTQEQWAAEVTQKLLQAEDGHRPLQSGTISKIFQENLDWVNDDSMLIHRCIVDNENRPKESTFVILVSSDRKLAKQMARASNQLVLRYDPSDVITRLEERVWSAESKISIQEIMEIDWQIRELNFPKDPNIYIDSGSLMSHAVQYNYAARDLGTNNQIGLVRRELINVEYLPQRKATYRETDVSVNGRYPIRREIFSPQLGKPKLPNFLRSRGFTPVQDDNLSTASPLTVNSRAISWRSSEQFGSHPNDQK